MRTTTLLLGLLAACSAVAAATPPDLINYQGVLRNASDKPQTGSFDMVFSFYDAATAGSEILVDSHTGGGNVAVSNGLFTAQLGGGTVTDGAGPGTYTALSQVFRDYGSVWMQIKVGSETLSPRIRVQSAAYALNASNLGGLPASNFVDTTGSTQTKAGHLVASDGLEGNSASGVGVQGIGATSGGTFANGSITAVAHLGYTSGADKIGVHGMGATAGGWFQDPGNTGWAYLGKPGYAVYASGTVAGGTFFDTSSDYASIASSGYSLYGQGSTKGAYLSNLSGSGTCTLSDGSRGLSAYGSSSGARFTDGSGDATDLALSGYGVSSYGGFTGGFFYNGTGDGQAFAGNGNYGIYGYGSTSGGYFYDTNNSGTAWIAYGDLGIDGRGAQAGGHFAKPYTYAEAYLAANNGIVENGVYGLSNGYSEEPGYFVDQYYGSYAYVGGGGAKIYGSGYVSFVQNHPQDPSKVIVYAAPEGDEVAVYTRGTARLVDGTARVPLGPTFAWVADPDTGLTAQLTPRGAAVPLAVESLTSSEMVVRGPADGPSDLTFDYAVWGLRIGFEDRPVVEPKRQEAFIPSADDTIFAAHPELRAFSARQRFATMEDAAGLARGTAAPALKSAIHVYDRNTDVSKLLASVPTSTAAGPAEPRPAPRPAELPSLHPDAGPAAVPAPRPTEPPAAPPLFPPNTIAVEVADRVVSGEVIANDAAHPGELRPTSIAADPGVVGIVAGEDGAAWTDVAPIAAAGSIALCQVDASYGAIAPNDLLVASPMPGHAMRAGDNPKQGTVVAKALQPLASGRGSIRVLVMSR